MELDMGWRGTVLDILGWIIVVCFTAMVVVGTMAAFLWFYGWIRYGRKTERDRHES